jgi:tetratricopeptide (TPR) repeat protein
MCFNTRIQRQLSVALVACFPFIAWSAPAFAQGIAPAMAGSPATNIANGEDQGSSVNIYVSVREPNGLPLSQSADVKLSCPLAGVSLAGPTKNAAVAEFFHIPAGDCSVTVTAAGFKPSRERTTIAEGYAAHNQYVYVYLRPESEPASAASRPVSLNVMKEIDKSLEAINNNRLDEARKHLTKAAGMAPQNPDVLYLLGMVDYRENKLDAAQQNFASAIARYPAHERALVALGEAQIKSGQYPAAEQTLQKALAVNRSGWRAHLLLANAYAAQNEYAKAESEAQNATGLAGENAPVAQAFLAQIQAAEAAQGGTGTATTATTETTAAEAQIHGHANAAANGFASETSTNLSPATLPAAAIPNLTIAPASLAPISSRAMHSWAPADVDASAPGVAPDVTCSEDDIVARAGRAATEQLENFEKFMASEHIEHQEVDEYGRPEHIKTRDFSYLAFIDHDKHGQVFLNEERDGGKGTEGFPTSLATVGLLGLGVDIFHPGFSGFLQFKCEGLGQWEGHPTWLMHFTQHPGQKSFLRLWQTRTATVEIPLKGRVWLSASTYQVLHIESDLREPIESLELTRDHLVIDYGPVNFEHGQSQLWLPWYADMYLELHGHRYHHRHTLSNYALFAVDTNNKINAPKEETPKEEKQKPQ